MTNNALRSLSMVIRKLPTKTKTESQQLLNDSIDYAKQAVTCDLGDSESWYVLGNAHLNNFFSGGQLYEHLDYALKAYSQSEKNQVFENPDLYHNRGTIYSYLEQYSKAIEDFDKAHSIDPNLGAKYQANNIKEFVFNVWKIIKKKGASKTDKMIKLVKSVPKTIGEVKFIKQGQIEVNHKQNGTDKSTSENNHFEHKEDNSDGSEGKNNEEEQKDIQIDTTKVIKYDVMTLKSLQKGINDGGVYIGKLIWNLPK